MVDQIALVFSALALFISALTAWLTLLRRGTVKMTQPTQIYLGPDMPRPRGDAPLPKVYLRTLLFSTAKRGRVIENMYVALSRNESHQNFSIWVHGEREHLVRGSGLFVGEAGVAANHHFLVPNDGSSFKFVAGHYRLEVFAYFLGDRNRRLLFSQTLEITREVAGMLEEPGTGLYFDWGPDASRYLYHVDKRPPPTDPDSLIELFRLMPHPVKPDATSR